MAKYSIEAGSKYACSLMLAARSTSPLLSRKIAPIPVAPMLAKIASSTFSVRMPSVGGFQQPTCLIFSL